jgi:hypothetical protein
MGVPERAGITAERLADRIADRRVPPGRGMTLLGPGSAVGRPGRHRNSSDHVAARMRDGGLPSGAPAAVAGRGRNPPTWLRPSRRQAAPGLPSVG